jgi:hypothetical protein
MDAAAAAAAPIKQNKQEDGNPLYFIIKLQHQEVS